MNRIFLSSVLLVSFLSFATTLVARESVERVTANPSNAVLAEDWGTSIMETMEDYLRKDAEGNHRGWQLGLHESNPSGGYIGWADVMIQTDPADVEYGRARTAAFNAAYTSAMAEFAGTMSVSIAVETVNRTFSDEAALDRIQAASTDSLLKALSDRVSTMSVAALDRGLERLGAEPESLPRYSRDEKHLLAENLLARTVVTEAAARIRGVRLLATFEDERHVGVLIIHHPRLENLANRILQGTAASPKPVDASGIRQSIDDLSSTELIFQHGIRVIPGSEGVPVILAFGQSSPAVSQGDSDRRIRMAISRSRQVAEMQADGAVAEFLNSTVFAARRLDQSASEQEYLEQLGRKMLSTESASFYEDLDNMIRQTAQAEVSGITTIRRWQANHPDSGHLYTGVVRMWTPSQSFEYSGQLRDERIDSEDPAESDELRADDEGDDKVRQSKDLMDGDW